MGTSRSIWFFRSLVVVLLAAALSGCGSFTVKPPQPVPQVPPPTPKTSVINVPITYSLSASLLDNHLPAAITRWDANDVNFDCLGPCGIRFDWHRRRVSVEGVGNTLTLSVLGNFKAKVVKLAGGWRSVASCGDDNSAWVDKPRLDAIVDSKIAVKDWGFITSSELRDKQLKIGDCNITAFDINVNGKINDRLAPRAESFLKELDGDIRSKLNLQNKAKEAWDTLQRPIAVADNVWLVVQPQSAGIVPISVRDNVLTTGISVTAKPKLVFGQPSFDQPRPLPSPQVAEAKDGYHVLVTLEATYDAITEKLRSKDGIVGRVYPVGSSRSFVVKDARIYGFGDQAILQVDLDGWKKGSVYFQGKPALDGKTYELFVDEFDYTVESKDVFVKLVERFPGFHEAFRRAMEVHGRYAFAADVTKIRNEMQMSLNRNLSDNLKLQGRIDQMNPIGVLATKDRFVGYVSMDGVLSIIAK